MSAKTRRKIDAATRLAMADLMNNCEQLIRDGKRSPEMVSALQGSLQLFKENRLAGAIPIPTSPKTTLPIEQILPRLSIEVSMSIMTPNAKRWCRERGLKYVGEILRVQLDPRASVSGEVETFLRSLGLPTRLNVDKLPWRPPYVDDPAVRAVWDKVLDNVLRRIHLFPGFRYVGEFLRVKHSSPSKLHYVQSLICREYRDRIHAGMVVMDWTPPAEDTEEWKQYVAERKAEARAAERIDRPSPEQLRRLADLIEACGTDSSLPLEVFERFAYPIPFFSKMLEKVQTIRELVTYGDDGEVHRTLRIPVPTVVDVRKKLKNRGLWFGMSVDEFEKRCLEAVEFAAQKSEA